MAPNFGCSCRRVVKVMGCMMRVDNCIPPPIFDIVGGAVNSVVNAAVNSVDNGGVELTQRVIINSFDVDLNAILQTTVEGTQEKKLNPCLTYKQQQQILSPMQMLQQMW